MKLKTYELTTTDNPEICIIWMHGLGSSSQNMMGIIEALPKILPITHIFIDAPIRQVTINNHMPMPAWYNILGVKLTDREDKSGILESAENIKAIINQQLTKGFKPEQIFLAGFSQGGAMALYTGLSCNLNLGGIISLSAYIPLVNELNNLKLKTIPIFLALGEMDPIVLPAWTIASYNWLNQQRFTNLTLNKYPMEHNICIEEIRDLYQWLNSQLSRKQVTENIK